MPNDYFENQPKNKVEKEIIKEYYNRDKSKSEEIEKMYFKKESMELNNEDFNAFIEDRSVSEEDWLDVLTREQREDGGWTYSQRLLVLMGKSLKDRDECFNKMRIANIDIIITIMILEFLEKQPVSLTYEMRRKAELFLDLVCHQWH